ncbi:MAG: hypothetical protein EA349_03265 [Halomonadaceae bacterium]|nr:MAG: hypothetical protein EA349_03265 [Halomonadaceae bacterium]
MRHLRSTLLISAITLAPAAALGAGFGLISQSAITGGTANAGTAVTSSDPATVFLNPAGMTRNSGQALSITGHLIMPEFDFSGTAESLAGPVAERNSSSFSSSVDGGDSALAPGFYYMSQFREDWAIGLAVNAPFGSQTDYGDNWVGRYNAIKSEISAININPNIAHQINDRVSVGFGISAQYFSATLSNMVEGNALAAQQGAPVTPTYDGVNDIKTEIDGSSWAVGINAGLLVDITERTQMGLAWRSQVRHRINGDLTFEPQTMAANTGGSTTIELPETATLSLKHQPAFSSRLNLLLDAQFTRWSRVDTIAVDADEGQDTELALDFQNSWRGALGATWDQTERLQLRAGVAFEESAVKDTQSRTPRVPDNHRRWASLGAGYQFSNGLQLDASYTHIFISDTPIEADSDSGTALNGTFKSSADILSAQATYRF